MGGSKRICRFLLLTSCYFSLLKALIFASDWIEMLLFNFQLIYPNLFPNLLRTSFIGSLNCVFSQKKDEDMILLVFRVCLMSVPATLMSTKESRVFLFVNPLSISWGIFHDGIPENMQSLRLKKEGQPTLKVLSGWIWCWVQPIFKCNQQKLLLWFVYFTMTGLIDT